MNPEIQNRSISKTLLRILVWAFGGCGIPVTAALYQYYNNPEAGIITPIKIGLVIIVAFLVISSLFDFLKRKDFWLFVKSKVRELFQLLCGIHTYAPAQYKYDVFDIHKKYYDLSKVVRSFICHNQGIYANFSFLASRIHRDLKEESKKPSPDNEKIRGYYKKLYVHLFENFFEDIMISMDKDDIQPYFLNRSEHEPRIVVQVWDGRKIKDVYRRGREYRQIQERKDNSAYLHIDSTGESYLCNDIPATAASGRYNNKRLRNDCAHDYLKRYKKYDNHEEWMNCWLPNKRDDGTTLRPSPASCYKSTMVIPITLLNNEGLSDEFREHFKIPKPISTSITDKKRATFGLVCFDHRERHYFRENDIDFGYVVADFISLYFIDYLNYIVYSGTFESNLDLVPEYRKICMMEERDA